MRAEIKVTHPDEVEVTVTLTTTVERWKQIRKDIKAAAFYGATNDLRRAIDALVTKACGNFDIEVEPTAEGEYHG